MTFTTSNIPSASEQAGNEILNLLGSVIGTTKGSVGLHEPEFSGKENEYLKSCIDTGWVSYAGGFVSKFEQSLAEYTGAKHAICVVNGTVALQTALILAGVQPNHEVIVPNLSFVATANAVVHCGAVPHFLDVDETTLGMDPVLLEYHLKNNTKVVAGKTVNLTTGRPITAVIPMHTFGHACEIDRLIEVAASFGVKVVEDAAEALGTEYKGKHLGTFGDLGTLSFNGNKIISSGGGGAILLNDEKVATRARHITTTAKVSHPWEFIHDEIGYNFRMPNLNAAVGYAQMEQLLEKLRRKRKLAKLYSEAFQISSFFEFFHAPQDSDSNFWLNTIRLKPKIAEAKAEILRHVNKHGFQCRAVWTPLRNLEMFSQCPSSSLETSEHLYNTLINIPSSPQLVKLDC